MTINIFHKTGYMQRFSTVPSKPVSRVAAEADGCHDMYSCFSVDLSDRIWPLFACELGSTIWELYVKFQFIVAYKQFALITTYILQSACELILSKELYFCPRMEGCDLNKEDRGKLEAFGCFCILSKISWPFVRLLFFKNENSSVAIQWKNRLFKWCLIGL